MSRYDILSFKLLLQVDEFSVKWSSQWSERIILVPSLCLSRTILHHQILY